VNKNSNLLFECKTVSRVLQFLWQNLISILTKF